MSKPSIAVDFDGFIHKYITKVKPWDPTRIADGPVPGAIEWLTRTSKDFDIIIHTCRFTPDEDTEAGWARVIDAVILPAARAASAGAGTPATTPDPKDLP